MRSTSRLSNISDGSPCAAEDMVVEEKERFVGEKWLWHRL